MAKIVVNAKVLGEMKCSNFNDTFKV